MNSLADDVTAMFADTFFLVFVQFFRIDWFAIFQNNVCFLNERYMTFKDIAGIIQTHRYDRSRRNRSPCRWFLYKSAPVR